MYGKIPLRWKCTYVTPSPKKSPYSDLSYYRPISISFLLQFLKVLKLSLVHRLENNAIIAGNQHDDFRTGRSTKLRCLFLLKKKSLSQNLTVDVIFFDFHKTFGSILFKRLSFKLQNINLLPRIVKWIRNFTTGRSSQAKEIG